MSHMRIYYLDLIRVVACLFVVAIHCNPWLYTTPHGVDAVFAFVSMLLIGVAVPLFFMISGAVTLPVTGDIPSFYRRRLPRLLGPLLFWGVVYALLPFLLGKTDWQTSWHELVLVPIKAPSMMGGVLWYLFVLIGLYLLAPFMSVVVQSKRNEEIFLWLCLLASLFSWVNEYIPNILGEGLASQTTMVSYFSGYIGYFVLGHYMHYHIKIGRDGRGRWKVFGILGLGMFLWGLGQLLFDVPYAKSSFALGAIMVSMSLFYLMKGWPLSATGVKMIEKLSPMTFGIYLSQVVVIELFTSKWYALSAAVWMQIVVILATFVVALLVTWILSRLPWSKYFIGI